MATLATPRLQLLPLSRVMIATRLEHRDFLLDCELPDAVGSVHFGPEWPGDAAEHYPDFLRYLGDAAYVESAFAVVERATLEAVGQIGTSGAREDDGGIEIGYGINPSWAGRGFATEAVKAVTEHLLALSGVERVTARTEAGNLASQRVLLANGFVRSTSARSEADGLFLWVRAR